MSESPIIFEEYLPGGGLMFACSAVAFIVGAAGPRAASDGSPDTPVASLDEINLWMVARQRERFATFPLVAAA